MDRLHLINTHSKMDKTLRISLFGLLLCFSLVNSVPYSKYGRTCKDIGCRNNEVCVIAEDPCTYRSDNKCGRYPTCQRAGEGGASCTTLVCPSGKYCKTVDGHPECVNTSPNLELDIFAEDDGGEDRDMYRRQSSGTQAAGGTRTASGYPAGSGYPSSGSANISPVPSAPLEASNGYPLSSAKSGTSGYPAGSGYPSSSNSGYPAGSGYPSSSNSGYPSGSGYPSSSNSGYPGGSGYPSSSNSGYPGGSGYPSSSNSGYPGGSGYPSSNPGSGYPSADSMQRRTSSNVNAGSPNYGQYPQSGYPQGGYGGQGYPQGGYPQGNAYPQAGYGQGYPQGGYQGQYPPQNGHPQNRQNPGEQKKPGIGEQLTQFAKDLAARVLTQTIRDKISGKSS